ncbi:MAG TPA: flavodoxin domain-containing protein [Actinospica sp.]|jgi:menaquinone-dependent protoporphyrinogen oxidase|nr:flavodoxin domain-containing protein [Actinospica sp.]
MRILVSAASRHGSTVEIARRVADALRRCGESPVVIPPDQVDDLADFDAVVLGSAVYLGRWLPAARHLARRFEAQLRERPVWLFSSGPVPYAALEADRPPVHVDALVERTGAVEHRVFGGRIVRYRLSPAEKLIVGHRVGREQDERDWTEIEGWAFQISNRLELITSER